MGLFIKVPGWLVLFCFQCSAGLVGGLTGRPVHKCIGGQTQLSCARCMCVSCVIWQWVSCCVALSCVRCSSFVCFHLPQYWDGRNAVTSPRGMQSRCACHGFVFLHTRFSLLSLSLSISLSSLPSSLPSSSFVLFLSLSLSLFLPSGPSHGYEAGMFPRAHRGAVLFGSAVSRWQAPLIAKLTTPPRPGGESHRCGVWA